MHCVGGNCNQTTLLWTMLQQAPHTHTRIRPWRSTSAGRWKVKGCYLHNHTNPHANRLSTPFTGPKINCATCNRFWSLYMCLTHVEFFGLFFVHFATICNYEFLLAAGLLACAHSHRNKNLATKSQLRGTIHRRPSCGPQLPILRISSSNRLQSMGK